MTDFFKGIPQIAYEGPSSSNEFAFRHYNPDEVVLGKRMEDHMRFAVAYWHSFAWPGGDPFGGQTFDRPWFGDTMALAKLKADVAFEMFDILGTPFYAFHDADARPEGATFAESLRNLEEIVDYLAEKQASHKAKLLWGTANLFSHLAHGDVALNITLTAVNSLIAILTMPLLVNLSLSYFMSADQAIPLQFAKVLQVFAIVLVPVALGMLVRRLTPAFAARMEKPMKLVAALFLAGNLLIYLPITLYTGALFLRTVSGTDLPLLPLAAVAASICATVSVVSTVGGSMSSPRTESSEPPQAASKAAAAATQVRRNGVMDIPSHGWWMGHADRAWCAHLRCSIHRG